MAKQDKAKFLEAIQSAYPNSDSTLYLGAGVHEGKTIPEAKVAIPLSTLNRHGLIAGATGTGKTKTLQVLCESLSVSGVPVLLMDIKGDLSGIAKEGSDSDIIKERAKSLDYAWKPEAFPVELLSLSGDKGVRLKATISEFGPVLLSRILNLNDTQQGVLALIFKYCDDLGIPLLDLKDIKKALQYLSNEGKEEIEKEYGAISSSSTATILRKIIELEGEGGEIFFGEPSFEVEDLIKKDNDGKGQISIIRLTEIQSKPRLFSTFMLSLLTEIYANFPEEGDLKQPKLALFIDEAHLVFEEASKDLVNQIESMVRLIRSKGVAVFFCTQSPTDIPSDILAQLGLKIQHALRAFTANDRKAIKEASANYPETDFYEVDKEITELGIGEAFITALNTKGIPTALVRTILKPPSSRMGILEPKEIAEILDGSDLVKKYAKDLDRESAYEILSKKVAEIADGEESTEEESQGKSTKKARRKQLEEDPSFVEKLSKNPLAREVGRTVAKEVTRGLLGMLGIPAGKRTKRKRSGLFGF
ncbi:ATPase [Leptospira ryugenii]|uniref:ATPase n=1 Tax=Leptospira ryugenii TaxID=1917863 RepID=A0A2P2DYP8_9LEPT|nr:helicase HerA-like domain-containing protein [Leptospira ryugenii]GBF49742.1 ATPase [Leptospira ryugenii]